MEARLKFKAAHGSLIWFVSGGLLILFGIIMAVMSVMSGLDGEGWTHILEAAICLVIGAIFLKNGIGEKKKEKEAQEKKLEEVKYLKKTKKN